MIDWLRALQACWDEDLLDADDLIGQLEIDLQPALDKQGETVEQWYVWWTPRVIVYLVKTIDDIL